VQEKQDFQDGTICMGFFKNKIRLQEEEEAQLTVRI
jgi:hypothetical protein